MSSGCLLRNKIANGTDKTTNMMDKVAHVFLQPVVSINTWVKGRKKTPPTPRPDVATASALPLLRSNHLATGTEVTMLFGAPSPEIPRIANRTIKCHGAVMMEHRNNATPIVREDNTINALGP